MPSAAFQLLSTAPCVLVPPQCLACWEVCCSAVHPQPHMVVGVLHTHTLSLSYMHTMCMCVQGIDVDWNGESLISTTLAWCTGSALVSLSAFCWGETSYWVCFSVSLSFLLGRNLFSTKLVCWVSIWQGARSPSYIPDGKKTEWLSRFGLFGLWPHVSVFGHFTSAIQDH